MSEEKVLIGSIDQGTTSTRFIIYDKHARHIGSHQVEFTQFCPQAGWVEHDPMEIVESVRVCITKAIDKATADGHNVDSGLKAIGLTNQRETTVVWSKSTGCPLHKAIVWMDVRTTSICRSHLIQFFCALFHFSFGEINDRDRCIYRFWVLVIIAHWIEGFDKKREEDWAPSPSPSSSHPEV